MRLFIFKLPYYFERMIWLFRVWNDIKMYRAKKYELSKNNQLSVWCERES